MWIAKSVVVDASPTRVTALPAPDGCVVVIAPAVESDKKNKSPAFKELNVFSHTTITFTVSLAKAAALAKPTTVAFSNVPLAALAFPT